MSTYRIIYLCNGLTDEELEVASEDLLAVTQMASSIHPHLTAEIWLEDRQVAVVRPCSRHGETH
jgi:hypothetical protein